MNIINRSLLAIALLGGFIPAKAMESQDPDKQDNAARHVSKFTFKNPNRESGLGDLSQLPDGPLLEIMLHCIDWDKTTLEDAFRTIQNLCQTSKYLYTFAHKNLFNAKDVKELRIKMLHSVMQSYLSKNVDFLKHEEFTDSQEVNALHIACSNNDVKFIHMILPQLIKNEMFDVINKKTGFRKLKLSPIDFFLLKQVEGRVVIGGNDFAYNEENNKREEEAHKKKKEAGYPVIKLFLSGKAKPIILTFLEMAKDPIMDEIATLLASKITCDDIMELVNDPNLYNQISVDQKLLLKQYHQCTNCKFE